MLLEEPQQRRRRRQRWFSSSSSFRRVDRQILRAAQLIPAANGTKREVLGVHSRKPITKPTRPCRRCRRCRRVQRPLTAPEKFKKKNHVQNVHAPTYAAAESEIYCAYYPHGHYFTGVLCVFLAIRLKSPPDEQFGF